MSGSGWDCGPEIRLDGRCPDPRFYRSHHVLHAIPDFHRCIPLPRRAPFSGCLPADAASRQLTGRDEPRQRDSGKCRCCIGLAQQLPSTVALATRFVALGATQCAAALALGGGAAQNPKSAHPRRFGSGRRPTRHDKDRAAGRPESFRSRLCRAAGRDSRSRRRLRRSAGRAP